MVKGAISVAEAEFRLFPIKPGQRRDLCRSVGFAILGSYKKAPDFFRNLCGNHRGRCRDRSRTYLGNPDHKIISLQIMGIEPPRQQKCPSSSEAPGARNTHDAGRSYVRPNSGMTQQITVERNLELADRIALVSAVTTPSR